MSILKTLISECITAIRYKLAIIVSFLISLKLLYLFLYFKKSEIMGNQCQREIILFGSNNYYSLRNMIYRPNIGYLPFAG